MHGTKYDMVTQRLSSSCKLAFVLFTAFRPYLQTLQCALNFSFSKQASGGANNLGRLQSGNMDWRMLPPHQLRMQLEIDFAHTGYKHLDTQKNALEILRLVKE